MNSMSRRDQRQFFEAHRLALEGKRKNTKNRRKYDSVMEMLRHKGLAVPQFPTAAEVRQPAAVEPAMPLISEEQALQEDPVGSAAGGLAALKMEDDLEVEGQAIMDSEAGSSGGAQAAGAEEEAEGSQGVLIKDPPADSAAAAVRGSLSDDQTPQEQDDPIEAVAEGVAGLQVKEQMNVSGEAETVDKEASNIKDSDQGAGAVVEEEAEGSQGVLDTDPQADSAAAVGVTLSDDEIAQEQAESSMLPKSATGVSNIQDPISTVTPGESKVSSRASTPDMTLVWFEDQRAYYKQYQPESPDQGDAAASQPTSGAPDQATTTPPSPEGPRPPTTSSTANAPDTASTAMPVTDATAPASAPASLISHAATGQSGVSASASDTASKAAASGSAGGVASEESGMSERGHVKSSGMEASDNAGKKRNSNSTEASGGPVTAQPLMVNPGRAVMPGSTAAGAGSQSTGSPRKLKLKWSAAREARRAAAAQNNQASCQQSQPDAAAKGDSSEGQEARSERHDAPKRRAPPAPFQRFQAQSQHTAQAGNARSDSSGDEASGSGRPERSDAPKRRFAAPATQVDSQHPTGGGDESAAADEEAGEGQGGLE